MKRAVFNAFGLALIASLTLPAAAQSNQVRRRASTPPQAPATSPVSVAPWTIEITTDGGFDGRGIGALKLTSDGKLVVTPPRVNRTCTYQLTPAELQPIANLVAAADARQWLASYADASNPHGCCDMTHTRLTLTRQENGAESTYTSNWYEMHRPLPGDLSALAETLFSGNDPLSLRGRFLTLCATSAQ